MNRALEVPWNILQREIRVTNSDLNVHNADTWRWSEEFCLHRTQEFAV